MAALSLPKHDQQIAQLFKTSLGPSKISSNSSSLPPNLSQNQEDSELAQQSKSLLRLQSAKVTTDAASLSSSDEFTEALAGAAHKRRKRAHDVDDLEVKYMRRLMHDESRGDPRREDPKRVDKQLDEFTGVLETSSSGSELEPESESESEMNLDKDHTEKDHVNQQTRIDDVPQHIEHERTKEDLELEKSSRTVFLANVSTLAITSKGAKKTLVKHLTSFSQAEGAGLAAVESIRFRSTPFSEARLPRKAAYAKKEVMDSTTKSTHAYVVYSTQEAAKEAARRLNGTVVLDRHLRVDLVSKPAEQAHRRCVFVGNLGFVDDETLSKETGDADATNRRNKGKQPADHEEGLWRVFGKIGVIDSVRVVRDKTTQVGKGFGYVQFKDVNMVEKALLLNGKMFPPMLPRKLRVVRAKSTINPSNSRQAPKSYRNGEKSSKAHTPLLRNSRLLGRAKSAQMNGKGKEAWRAAETSGLTVFEGRRATQNPVKKGSLKIKRGKPQNRSSRRGADFKRRQGTESTK